MTTNFPSSADNFTNPTSSSSMASPSHSAQHADVNDAVEAIETALLDGAPLHIDDANERVGIGTTSPATELNVVTNGNTTTYDEVARFDVTNNADGSDYSRLTVGQVTENKMFLEAADETNTKGDLLFQPYGGNVGINDSTPSYKLDVNGDINATGDIRVGGVAINGNLISGATFYTTNNSQYAPEYGSNYYRSNLYTVSAPSGKSISNVVLTPQPYTPYNPAWVTLTAVSSSSYSYYVYSKGASAGNIRYFLDCR